MNSATFGDGLDAGTRPIRSFLMIGQSNMAGRGDIGSVSAIENPDCLMLRMGRWQKMHEPINPDRAIFEGKYRSGVCLTASFADGLARAEGCRVGLIPCADGGTCIDQWMPGGVLFDHAVMMARLAMRQSTLSGILWHQGESDCKSEEQVAEHREKFVSMITALRRELGAEELPLVLGEISERISCLSTDLIRRMNAQYRAIAKELSHCGVASAEGLSLKSDGLHFDAASLRTFGERYLEVYRSLV